MATTTQQTLVEEIRTRVGNAVDERGVADLGNYVTQAVLEFSRYSPRTAIIEIAGDGTDEYSLPSPYLDGFSVIERVRRVTNATSSTAGFNEPPKYLTTDEFRVDHDTDGNPVIHTVWSPATTDLLVLKATALHAVTPTTSGTTIPDHQAGAFADLAASLLLDSAATSALSSVPQDTAGDLVLPQVQLANAYRSAARDMRARFSDFFGIGKDDGGTATPVLVTKDIDAGRRKGRERLTHPRSVW